MLLLEFGEVMALRARRSLASLLKRDYQMAGALRKRRMPRRRVAGATGGVGFQERLIVPRGPEKKFVDINVAGPTATIAANSATVTNPNLSTGFLFLNLCQSGDTVNSRDGNIVKMQFVSLDMDIAAGANTELSDAEVRVVVALLNSTVGANIVVGGVLSDMDEVGAATTTFNSGASPASQYGVRILRDVTSVISKVSGPAPLRHLRMFIPMNGTPVRYNGTANPMTYAQIVNSGVVMIAFGRMTGAGTLPTIANFHARYCFSEK